MSLEEGWAASRGHTGCMVASNADIAEILNHLERALGQHRVFARCETDSLAANTTKLLIVEHSSDSHGQAVAHFALAAL